MSITTETLDNKRSELKRLETQYKTEQAEIRRKAREEENARAHAEKEERKNKLAAYYKIPRDKKFERAWDIAWDQGHSSGYEEIENYFTELVELILP